MKCGGCDTALEVGRKAQESVAARIKKEKWNSHLKGVGHPGFGRKDQ